MQRAAVLRYPDAPLEVALVETAEPSSGEIEVAMVAAGICPLDVALVDGQLSTRLPIIPGHEGAGIVSRVGPDVNRLQVGDHVVLTSLAECGRCFWCLQGDGFLCEAGRAASSSGTMIDGTSRVQLDGEPVYQMSCVGAFAETVVLPARSAVPIHESVDLRTAALIGCAVLIGVAAATRAAVIRPGDSVAVLGSGPVGQHALQGARVANAGMVACVGPDAGPFEELLGASTTIPLPAEAAVDTLLDLTFGRGVEVVIDTVGSPRSVRAALRSCRRGGQVIVTNASERSVVPLRLPEDLVGAGITIRGSGRGNAKPHEDVPILLELHESGLLRLDQPTRTTVSLDAVNDGLRMLDDQRLTNSRVLLVG